MPIIYWSGAGVLSSPASLELSMLSVEVLKGLCYPFTAIIDPRGCTRGYSLSGEVFFCFLLIVPGVSINPNNNPQHPKLKSPSYIVRFTSKGSKLHRVSTRRLYAFGKLQPATTQVFAGRIPGARFRFSEVSGDRRFRSAVGAAATYPATPSLYNLWGSIVTRVLPRS